jgi:hypothetical protein
LEKIEKTMTEEGVKYKSFIPTFVPLFNKYLVKPLEVQIKDLRSEIVRQSATTITAIARLLGADFKKAAVTLLKPLIDCASQTNKIMRGTTKRSHSSIAHSLLIVLVICL